MSLKLCVGESPYLIKVPQISNNDVSKILKAVPSGRHMEGRCPSAERCSECEGRKGLKDLLLNLTTVKSRL